MEIQKIAAFSDADKGGNPTGVVLLEESIQTKKMQCLATELGYTETAFASLQDNGTWFARFFSPETEMPYCGHGASTLGAVLAENYGSARYQIRGKHSQLVVEGQKNCDGLIATTRSSSTKSRQLSACETSEILDIFGYRRDQLNPDIEPAIAQAGAGHYILALRNREDLASMYYELEEGRKFLREKNVFSIMLICAQSDQVFHARNTYAAWGVMEDPATAAAATALSGYLRDIDWPHKNALKIIQGEDMGSRSVLRTEFSDEKNSSVKVSGRMRKLV